MILQQSPFCDYKDWPRFVCIATPSTWQYRLLFIDICFFESRMVLVAKGTRLFQLVIFEIAFRAHINKAAIILAETWCFKSRPFRSAIASP